MSFVLFDSDGHRCVAFNDLVRGDDGVQANQFLVTDNGYSALIDPGGALIYCTCSLLRAEGEAQADAFLARTPAAAVAAIASDEPIPAEFVAEGRLRTRPDQWHTFGGLDGFFAARFVRR